MAKFKHYPLAFIFMASSAFGGANPDLQSDIQKASYAIGQQIGANVKTQGVDIDVDVLAASMKEVLAGKPSRMTDDEMQAALTKMQQKVQEQLKVIGDKNKVEADKYLAKNKTVKGVIATASGLQYKVIKEGDAKGKAPSGESKVKVHYVGKLMDGKEFDSSIKRGQPAEFPVNGVIPGWTEALKLMKPGAKWELAVPPELAYGDKGRPGIPPNSLLLFEVELLSVE